MMTGDGPFEPSGRREPRLPLHPEGATPWIAQGEGVVALSLVGEDLAPGSLSRRALPTAALHAAEEALVTGEARVVVSRSQCYVAGGRRAPLPALALVRAAAGTPGSTLRAALDRALAELDERLASRAAADPFAAALAARPSLAPTIDVLRRVARTSLSVLFVGETGTGKEVLARALHVASQRSGPFVAENCAALPADLIEAELFGVRRGAFTGAHADRTGRIQRSHRGTLFLDEIGDLPPVAQGKLLRVLQEREVRPVGASEAIAVDLRVVSATLHDLAAPEHAERFRRDLFFRVAGIVVRLPSLAETRADLPFLVVTLLERIASEGLGPGRHLTREALCELSLADLPGNVRELDHALRRASALASGPRIGLADIQSCLGHSRAAPRNLEERAIQEALRAARGVKVEAARRLGWTRQKLYRRLSSLGLDGEGASTKTR